MKIALIVGGPILVVLTATFLVASGIVTFGEVEGLEIEQESIEYRESAESAVVSKQPGLAKYANIYVRMPVGVENWKFIFERKTEEDEIWQEYTDGQKEEPREEGEMIQIEPPVLILPAR